MIKVINPPSSRLLSSSLGGVSQRRLEDDCAQPNAPNSKNEFPPRETMTLRSLEGLHV